ncbi:unnamed protein product [Spodoptera exigua]|nr:unnamed protein product [Spodoptera exigua]
MEANFQKFFDKIKVEMQNQTKEITESLMSKMEERLQPLVEENCKLKKRVEELEKKIDMDVREKRMNNLMVFGLEEKENSNLELVEAVTEEIKTLGIDCDVRDISKAYRVGKKHKTGKARPVKITISTNWKRYEILKNKKKSENTYFTEDFPKHVLEIRRSLQDKLKEERNKGHYAFIRYDTLVVNENKNKEKRKRSPTRSPQEITDGNITLKPAQKISRANVFDRMRSRPTASGSNDTKK